MTEDQREIKRKKKVIEYAEKNGNIKTACRRFGLGAVWGRSGAQGAQQTKWPRRCLVR